MKNKCLLFICGVLCVVITSSAQTTYWEEEDSSGNIYYNGGNIGIGNASPDFILDISTTTSYQGIQLYHSSGRFVRWFNAALGGGGYNSITVANDAGFIFGDLSGGINSVANGLVIAPHRSSVSGIRITPEGTVGIGTPLTQNPYGCMLAVRGLIGATEIRVEDTEWPDYVFDETYNLRPLDEVEDFIKNNGHLPEVPAAREVEEEGHQLGEMDEILLRKIEELTLYVIELKKENQQQALKYEALERRLVDLQSKQ